MLARKLSNQITLKRILRLSIALPFGLPQNHSPQPDNFRATKLTQELRMCVRCARTFGNFKRA
jgi:hypothetical protein